MINENYYCNICDKYFLNKSNHNKTKLHTQLSLSVVNKYYFVDVPVIEIDNVINKQIFDYNKKFLNFDCWCKIQSGYFCEKVNLVWINSPNNKIQEKIISNHNCNQNEFVYMKIWFITDLNCATYEHYFQLPKPMIERKVCQIIDRNPNLIKILNQMPEPYKRHIIIKHWGFQNKCPDGIIYDYTLVNWMDLETNIII